MSPRGRMVRAAVGTPGRAGLVAAGLAVVLAGARYAVAGTEPGVRVRVLLEASVPQPEGDSLRIRQVEVQYAPGAASKPHGHSCPVVAYVVRGAIRSRVADEPERTYAPGETFYEPAGAAHLVSANASASAPAVLLATFVCRGAEPRTTSVVTHRDPATETAHAAQR